MLKIGRCYDRLIFNIVVPYPERRSLYWDRALVIPRDVSNNRRIHVFVIQTQVGYVPYSWLPDTWTIQKVVYQKLNTLYHMPFLYPDTKLTQLTMYQTFQNVS